MRLLYGVLGTAMLGLSACAELGIQLPDLRGSTAESTGPVLAEQALSNAGRFPEDVSDEVATPKPVPPLPARKPEVPQAAIRSEEHTSELQSLMRISYAVFCLKKKKKNQTKSTKVITSYTNKHNTIEEKLSTSQN